MNEFFDIELESLPEDTDPLVFNLVDLWGAACADLSDAEVPSRLMLDGERLGRWRDHISIYEFLPDKNDFLIRIEGAMAIEMSGDNFKNTTPREIDLKFKTNLMSALRHTLSCKRPTFYRVRVMNARNEMCSWLRVLLPVQTQDRQNQPVSQVLGACFECPQSLMG
ncbi:hypothetical protein LPB41_15655 [Thalassospira sp. MA62]|nr:hypothetical protein [Thalassospira sp. MA62]